MGLVNARIELGEPNPLGVAWDDVLRRYGYFCRPIAVRRRGPELSVEVTARVPVQFEEKSKPLYLDAGIVGTMVYRVEAEEFRLISSPTLPALLKNLRESLTRKRQEVDQALIRSSKLRFGRIREIRFPSLSPIMNLAEMLRDQSLSREYGFGHIPMDIVMKMDKERKPQYRLLVNSGLAQLQPMKTFGQTLVPTEELRLLLDRSKRENEEFLDLIIGRVIESQYDQLIMEFRHPFLRILTRTASTLFEMSYAKGTRVALSSEELGQVYVRQHRSSTSEETKMNVKRKYSKWLVEAEIFRERNGKMEPDEEIYEDFSRDMDSRFKYFRDYEWGPAPNASL